MGAYASQHLPDDVFQGPDAFSHAQANNQPAVSATPREGVNLIRGVIAAICLELFAALFFFGLWELRRLFH